MALSDNNAPLSLPSIAFFGAKLNKDRPHTLAANRKPRFLDFSNVQTVHKFAGVTP